MTTTAEYRRRARVAENSGFFRVAAGYYRLAIYHYPESQKVGVLGQKDLEYLQKKMLAARRLAKATENFVPWGIE